MQILTCRCSLLIILLLLFIFSLTVNAQYSDDNALGLELQIYPTGIIPGIQYRRRINNQLDFMLRIGANIVDHRDQGIQDNEEGEGFGFTPGIRYYLHQGRKGWFSELRTDIWFNQIEWENSEPVLGFGTSGVSDITVFQPTVLGGYAFALGDHWLISPTVALGLEINIRTKGAEIGDGLIGLIGIQLERTF